MPKKKKKKTFSKFLIGMHVEKVPKADCSCGRIVTQWTKRTPIFGGRYLKCIKKFLGIIPHYSSVELSTLEMCGLAAWIQKQGACYLLPYGIFSALKVAACSIQSWIL